MNINQLFPFIILVIIHSALDTDANRSQTPNEPKHEANHLLSDIKEFIRNKVPLSPECKQRTYNLFRYAYLNLYGIKNHIYCRKDGSRFLRAKVITKTSPDEKVVDIEIDNEETTFGAEELITFRGEEDIIKDAEEEEFPAIATIQEGSAVFPELKRRLDSIGRFFKAICDKRKQYTTELKIHIKAIDVIAPYEFNCDEPKQGISHKGFVPRPEITLLDGSNEPFILGYSWEMKAFLTRENSRKTEQLLKGDALLRDWNVIVDWKIVEYNDNWRFRGVIPQEDNLYRKKAVPGSDSVRYNLYDFEKDVEELFDDINGGELGDRIIVPADRPEIWGAVRLGASDILQVSTPSVSAENKYTGNRYSFHTKSVEVTARNGPKDVFISYSKEHRFANAASKLACTLKSIKMRGLLPYRKTDYDVYYADLKVFRLMISSEQANIQKWIKIKRTETVIVIFEYQRRHFIELAFSTVEQSYAIADVDYIRVVGQGDSADMAKGFLKFGVFFGEDSTYVSEMGNLEDVVGIKLANYDRRHMRRSFNLWSDVGKYPDWRYTIEDGGYPIEKYDPSQLASTLRPRIRMDALSNDLKNLCDFGKDDSKPRKERLYSYFGIINIVRCVEEGAPIMHMASVTRSHRPGKALVQRLETTKGFNTEDEALKTYEIIGFLPRKIPDKDVEQALLKETPTMTYLRGDDFFGAFENRMEEIAALAIDSCKRKPSQKHLTFDIVISTAIFPVVIQCGSYLVDLSTDGSAKSNVNFIDEDGPLVIRYNLKTQKYLKRFNPGMKIRKGKRQEEKWIKQNSHQKTWTAIALSGSPKKAREWPVSDETHSMVHFQLKEFHQDMVYMSKQIDCENTAPEKDENVVIVRIGITTFISATYSCKTTEDGKRRVPLMTRLHKPNLSNMESAALDYFNGNEKESVDVLLDGEETSDKIPEDSHVYKRQYWKFDTVLEMMKSRAEHIKRFLGDTKYTRPIRVNFVLELHDLQRFVFATTYDPTHNVFGLDDLELFRRVLNENGSLVARKQVFDQLVIFLVDEFAFTPHHDLFKDAAFVALEPYDIVKRGQMDYSLFQEFSHGNDWVIEIMVPGKSSVKALLMRRPTFKAHGKRPLMRTIFQRLKSL